MPTFESSKFTDNVKKIFWITVAWTIFSLSQFLTGYGTLQQFDCDMDNISVSHYLTGSIIVGIIAGILGGSALVFTWEKWLRSKSYGVALTYIFGSYCMIYIFVTTISVLFFETENLGLSIFHKSVWENSWNQIFEWETFHGFVTWLIIILITLIALLVNDKYGPGVFRSFLLGKYFHPSREERIFMFLDLRSSTSIAEKLSAEHYFNFIKNVFKDVTPAILNARGEIYQYVGDEIVISWKMENGLKNANCVQCFFNVQKDLLQKANYYKMHYEGIEPEFKAGLHYGFVMAGEVGVVKRDISYTGDVLNTTARIQSKCNELGVNILMSQYLLEKLKLVKGFHLKPQIIGEILLRGKSQKMNLATV